MKTRNSSRFVYVPTHRECGEVLAAVGREVVASGLTADLNFAVIDDRPLPHCTQNRSATIRLAKELGISTIWVGPDEWRACLGVILRMADLTSGDLAIARKALDTPTGSYAAGMNKASLLAAMLGARTLHRRDSDELPAVREHDGATALKVEALALDGQLSIQSDWNDRAPYFVGSHVLGEPTKDHRDLLAVSPVLERELEALTSRRSSLSRTMETSPTMTANIGAGVSVERDTVGRTEVGVSAVRDVFRWVPEMPAVGILGTDHFQRGLLYLLEYPLMWHEVAATHRYERTRADQADHRDVERYTLAEFRYVVLKQYWNAFRDILTMQALSTKAVDDLASTYSSALIEVLSTERDRAEYAADEFVSIHERCLGMATDEIAERQRARIGVLGDSRAEVVDYVDSAVREYSALSLLWPRLVEAAENADLPDLDTSALGD